MKGVEQFRPEIHAGGYTRSDGTVEFYGRINALIAPDMTVLDFGAGRGRGTLDDPVPYRRALRTLRGKCARLVGLDVDEAVLENPSLDEAVLLNGGGRFPFDSATFDLIISDAVFEHIADPRLVAGEMARVLKPGGWICARTPNRWGYIGVGVNAIPNLWHIRFLSWMQPHRKELDVFPTRYKLNTRRCLNQYFPPKEFDNFTYGYFGDPAYFADSRFMWTIMHQLYRLTPEMLAPMLLIFMRKLGLSSKAG